MLSSQVQVVQDQQKDNGEHSLISECSRSTPGPVYVARRHVAVICVFESAAPSMNRENQAQLSTATRHLRHLSTLPIDAKIPQRSLGRY